MRRKSAIVIAATAAAASLVLGACSDDDDGSSAAEPATAESTPPAADGGDATIAEIVTENTDFSTLEAAVTAADLGETLSGPGPYTVFAPTDAAFAQLPEGTLDALLEPANQEQLAGILTYHVLPDEVMAAEVTAGEVTTINGAPFTVAVSDGGVTITDGAGNDVNVIQTDVAAANGVIHVIDAVLLPEEA